MHRTDMPLWSHTLFDQDIGRTSKDVNEITIAIRRTAALSISIALEGLLGLDAAQCLGTGSEPLLIDNACLQHGNTSSWSCAFFAWRLRALAP